MPRLMSFAKTVATFLDGSKTVTRRDGWRFLKVGDIVEAVEWSTRVGKRYVCNLCFSLGGSKYRHGDLALCGGECEGPGEVVYRLPRRLGPVRIVSVRRERLGDITAEDVEREGFAGKSPAWFVEMYCKPRKPEPGKVVTRIEFERIEQ